MVLSKAAKLDGYRACSCNIVAVAIAIKHGFSGGYNCSY